MLNSKQTIQGFTLVELLVALAINSLLLLAFFSIFSQNIQNYTRQGELNRLDQQLNLVIDLISNDIRRAGFWANAASDIGTGQNNNPFMSASTDIKVNSSGNCILFSYDHNGDGNLPTISTNYDDERYGYRLLNQAVQVRPPGAPFDCNAASNSWENITDTHLVLITNLQFTLNTSTLTNGSASGGIAIRTLAISITGRLKNSPNSVKTMAQYIRIRNDKFIP